MAVEQRAEAPLPTERDPRRDTAYLAIAGGLGANHGMVEIENAFRSVTGSQHVRVFNSEMSMDPVNRERYRQQSEFIKTNIEAGRNVEVVTHSIVDIEASRDIALILEQDPEFFENSANASKLTVAINAGAGFEQSKWDQVKFAVNYFRLGGPRNRAINTATAFPARNMDAESFANGVRMVFDKRRPTDIPVIPFEPQDDRYAHLDQDKSTLLDRIDAKLKKNIDKGRRWRARRNLRQRGKLLKGELQDVFDGKHVEGNVVDAPPVSFPHLVGRPEVRSLLQDMHSDILYTTVGYLISKGVNVKLFGFEHDMATTEKSMRRFVEQTASDTNRGEIAIIEMLGHSGLVLQPRYWVDAVTKHNVTDLAQMRRGLTQRDAA